MNPTVSVIMPAYNGERFIEEAVRSILDQSFKDLELIVVDDGSEDGTKQVLDKYEGRIVYHRQDNHGFSHAISKGISLAKGEYIAFLGQDDVFMPEKIAKEVQALNTKTECALVYSDAIFIDEKGEELYRRGTKEEKVLDDLFHGLYFRGDFIVHSSVMVRRNILDDFGDFPFEKDFEICSDYLLYLLLSLEHRFCQIREALVKVRKWSGQLTSEKRKTMFREEREVIRMVRDLRPGTYWKSFFDYMVAMSNQYLKESAFSWSSHHVLEAVGLGLKSLFYCPINFSGWWNITRSRKRRNTHGA